MSGSWSSGLNERSTVAIAIIRAHVGAHANIVVGGVPEHRKSAVSIVTRLSPKKKISSKPTWIREDRDPTHTEDVVRWGAEHLGSDVLQTVRAAAVNACSVPVCSVTFASA